jgi:hypothetical protein
MRTLCDRFVALVIAFAVLAVAGSAMAQSFEDALARFSADSFADTETGINGVAGGGAAPPPPPGRERASGRGES